MINILRAQMEKSGCWKSEAVGSPAAWTWPRRESVSYKMSVQTKGQRENEIKKILS